MTGHPLARYLPHRPPMILLDELVSCDEDSVATIVTIGERTLFYDADEGGVPAYVGIEYMAQTCGVFAGVRALATRRPVRVGFLLGSRNYKSATPVFGTGQRLLVSARQELADDNMWGFDCRIESEGTMLVTARLNLFQPDDLGVFRASPPSGAPQ